MNFDSKESSCKCKIYIFVLSNAGVYEVAETTILLSEHGRSSNVISQLPAFIQEPPSYVLFSNNTGAQITCLAHGNPTPSITWLTKDGTMINTVPGLR